MEKIKELFDLAVEYCKAEPFHAGVLGGIGALVLITLIALMVKGRKNKKARKAAKKAAATLATQEAKEKIEVKLEAEPVKEVAKSKPVQKEVKPEPVKEEVKPEPVKKEVESVPAPTAKEEMAVTEEKPAIKTTVKPIEKAESKAHVTLHDEFKDADTDLDFYEEDETDQVARYSGKWVICRVVTEDNADEEETFFFELRASNGEKLLSSEEYTTYNGAIRGIQTHKTNILKNNFRITLSKKGDYIFKLLNGKGMLLCMGEHYATRARCESAIESAKRFAKTAFVDENIQDQVVKVPVEDDEAAPIHESFNGKWVIDCHISDEGEKVFFFELFANNGERLLSSEEYSSYIGAVNGIQTHKANIEKGNFRISLTKHGDYIYKLLNGNGQLLCLGEHYKTKTRCKNAVESVKRFAMNSPILTDPELTK